MRIIDVHAHIFPGKIAQKASDAIGDFYDIPIGFGGTVETLLELGRQAGVDTFVVHSVATIPQQVQSINDFIAQSVEEHPGKLVGFATLHPGLDDIAAEVDRTLARGLRGIKIHPDFQKFNLDSPAALRMFEIIEGRLPVLVHTGDVRYEYSRPQRMAAVLDRFPGLVAVCAHFGGWSQWLEAADVLAGRPNVYVDTSSSLYAITPEQAAGLVDRFGADQVLFGSDYPMWSPGDELERLAKLNLAPAVLEKVLHGNAERLLGL